MNIAYVINGLNGGGAAFPMVSVIGLMRELGHEVTVLALHPQDGKAAERLRAAGIPFEVLGGHAFDGLASAVRLFRWLRRERPDLVWTSLTRGTAYGQVLGCLLGIPVVSWQHSDYLKPGNLRLLRLTRGLSRRWVADSDAVRAFTERALGVPADRIEVWPPFVADPSAPVGEAWPGHGQLRLGTLGRLHPSKRYDVLLRAFARARELGAGAMAHVELQVAGDGPDQAELEALAASLGIAGAVRFAGFVAPQPFLAGLHGYVQTSVKEGFCIAAHEAMQAGLAVISTRVGQLAHSVVPGETGWLCEVGDVDGIAQAMVEWSRDPARAHEMGRESRCRLLGRYGRDRFRQIGERLLERIERELPARTNRGAGVQRGTATRVEP